jgi:DNA invertase Pin-like site-specific DNA recombinase
MLIGYARISTRDQNLGLQNDALLKAGCEKIFMDKESGAVSARSGLIQAMEMLREGDTRLSGDWTASDAHSSISLR